MKRLKHFVRPFLCALLIQIGIVAAYVCFLLGTKPVVRENCVSRQIVIEDIQYVRVYEERRCRVTSDGVFYEFPGLGIFDEFSGREIYEQLHLGDTLDILYVKECKVQNAKCKMMVCLRHGFNSSPQGIPQFCILNSAFCISIICRR